MTTQPYCVVVDYDPDPDLSWLQQSCYDPASSDYEPTYRTVEDMDAGRNPYDGDWYRDPDNHVVLDMVAYDEDGAVLDSLGGIDFLAENSDWRTGTFYRLSTLEDAPYLRKLAEEMGLSE